MNKKVEYKSFKILPKAVEHNSTVFVTATLLSHKKSLKIMKCFLRQDLVHFHPVNCPAN